MSSFKCLVPLAILVLVDAASAKPHGILGKVIENHLNRPSSILDPLGLFHKCPIGVECSDTNNGIGHGHGGHDYNGQGNHGGFVPNNNFPSNNGGYPSNGGSPFYGGPGAPSDCASGANSQATAVANSNSGYGGGSGANSQATAVANSNSGSGCGSGAQAIAQSSTQAQRNAIGPPIPGYVPYNQPAYNGGSGVNIPAIGGAAPGYVPYNQPAYNGGSGVNIPAIGGPAPGYVPYNQPAYNGDSGATAVANADAKAQAAGNTLGGGYNPNFNQPGYNGGSGAQATAQATANAHAGDLGSGQAHAQANAQAQAN